MPSPESPCGGLTVLNVSRGVAGATAAQLLAGLGARVIRVEDPPGSDGVSPSRSVLAGWDTDGDLFAHLGRGSESVVVDPTTAEGVATLQSLAAQAQVVIEDEAPSDERGLRATLRASRDQGASFVLATITPFGLTGPSTDLPGSDLTVFASSGLMAHVGEPTDPPVQLPGWLVQAHVGIAAFTAITASLALDGGPTASHDLDIAALDVLANSNPHAICAYSYRGKVGGRVGNRFVDGYPWTVLPCKDGYIGVIVPQTRWDVFCLWLDRPDLIDDPMFRDRAARSRHPDELDEILRPWASGMTKEELYREAQARGLPFGAVFTVPDGLASAQLAARRFFDTPDKEGGMRFAGLPFLLDEVRPSLPLPPALGEQTDAMFTEAASLPDGDRTPSRRAAVAPSLPLDGIRVLELTTAWAGPFAGRLLADLGAEVIRVESRRRLDIRGPAVATAGLADYPDGDPGAEPWNRSGRFHERNRNKLSLALELQDPMARDAFLRLVAVSDVIIENFAPRVLRQLRLDYPHLVEAQPNLVMLSLSGFGQTGPERDYVAYGSTVEQVSGLDSILGLADNPPLGSGLYLPDVLSGMLGAGLVLAALRGRAVHGRGVYIDVAETEVVAWLLGHLTLGAQAGRSAATDRPGNRHPVFVPHGVFPCSGDDRWVAMAVRTDAEWAALAREIGAPDLAGRFATGDLRRAMVDEIEQIVWEWTRSLSAEAVTSRLTRAGVPASPVAAIDEVFANPHLRAREIFSLHPIPGSHPREVSGGLWVADGRRPGLLRSAPALGEHNDYVLGDVAGLAPTEIEQLRSRGLLGTLPAELEQE